jgi:alkanesulfonate monooxygenase SsuD/methylene tetrahydromethanopterin reductase-like flavin-dependent oxidoreductase (luciferase family)
MWHLEGVNDFLDYLKVFQISFKFGFLWKVDLLPKSTSIKLPLFVTGYSRQNNDWIAENSDGWLTYLERFFYNNVL